MAKTQKINYGNAVALPVGAGGAHTPPDGTTKAANELVPDRPYTRRAMWVKNLGANNMNVIAPSGSVYPLGSGETLWYNSADVLEDGPYTITGTAADTFSFWEAY